MGFAKGQSVTTKTGKTAVVNGTPFVDTFGGECVAIRTLKDGVPSGASRNVLVSGLTAVPSKPMPDLPSVCELDSDVRNELADLIPGLAGEERVYVSRVDGSTLATLHVETADGAEYLVSLEIIGCWDDWGFIGAKQTRPADAPETDETETLTGDASVIHSDLPTERDARDMFTDELDATDIMADSARLDILLAYAHEVRADARGGRPMDPWKLWRIAEIALSLSSDPTTFGDQEAIDWPVDADGHFSDPI